VIGESYADATAPASAPLVSSAIGTAVLTAGAGTGAYSASMSASAQLSYSRHASTLTTPFTAAITLTVTASDASENAVTGNGIITTAAPLVFNGTGGLGIDFDSGAQFRYGRLQIGTAKGELLVPLAVPMETQFWNGTIFTTNTADHCTTLDVANIGLGNYAGNLSSGETTPSFAGAFASGKKNLTLSAPGAGNNGSVDVVVNLGSTVDPCVTFNTVPSTTGANQPWLRGRWCGATESKDTTGRAIFGVRLGAEEVIHFRENF
jgi:MSHA biogenesis protein MshQ